MSEAGDGSPLSGAAASDDDGDTVVGVSYGMDAADMALGSEQRSVKLRSLVIMFTVHHSLGIFIVRRGKR
ncbi:hypothetical protein EYF80_023030 [Liparis tanakae]|uniref:Uncharacterized protein n=1 Tax=Liparis tanakae TaxID=230148 RepID=A0A4Z2HLR2_9TELE|nr:hypothetical protein EYF80_023030 [Liparis tanakae]